MNRQMIQSILLELAGEGLMPDRGVGADDILLTQLNRMPAEERPTFWRDFGAVAQELWQERNADAFSNAAAFVARAPQSLLPAGEEAVQAAGFLLHEPGLETATAKSKDELRLNVSALRVLSTLGLGDRTWWRACFHVWLDEAKRRKESDVLHVWQAVLHASRGLLNSGEIVPNFDAWFETAYRAAEFPALEVFTLLADQADVPNPDKDALKEDVLEAYNALHAHCYETTCPPSIDHLKDVIEAWLEDRLQQKADDAKQLLMWKAPDLDPPSKRLDRAMNQNTELRASA